MRFIFALAMLAVASALTPVTLNTPKSERIEGEYMVQFSDPNAFRNFKLRAKSLFSGIMNVNEFGDYMGFSAQLSEDELWAVQNMDGVSIIEPNTRVEAYGQQNNVEAWGIDRSDQRSLPLDRIYRWADNAAGQGVTVAVLDTGILTTHSDYSGRAHFGADCTGRSCSTSGTQGDPQGHGTHCAGTVGSNTYGIAKNATLLNVRVLGSTGSGSIAGIVNGIEFVVNNVQGRRIISMSLGGGASTALDNAVNSAFNSGVLSVVAAGNSNNNACNSYSPARAAQAVTVAASDRNDRKASFSSYGPCVDVYAPGASVLSTSRTGGTATMSGTSMACPHVAGYAAVLASRGFSAAQIRTQLVEDSTANVITGNPSGTPNRLLFTNPQ